MPPCGWLFVFAEEAKVDELTNVTVEGDFFGLFYQ